MARPQPRRTPNERINARVGRQTRVAAARATAAIERVRLQARSEQLAARPIILGTITPGPLGVGWWIYLVQIPTDLAAEVTLQRMSWRLTRADAEDDRHIFVNVAAQFALAMAEREADQ